MAQITVDDKTFEAPEGKKLVLALEDGGIDILHRCGGIARCTTCRVEVLEGDRSAYLRRRDRGAGRPGPDRNLPAVLPVAGRGRHEG